MKKLSPVFRADVKFESEPPHQWVEVHFKDPQELKRFAASLVKMADSGNFDHVHLQDHELSRENTDSEEIIFLKSGTSWKEKVEN